MDFQHITVKLFTDRADFELHELIPVFHRWIQVNALPEVMLIDVADYAHVPEGPGVMLIAHEGHFSFDDGAIRSSDVSPGVVYANKRKATGSTADRIRHSLALAVKMAVLLENEEALAGRVNVGTNRLLIRFDDYLHVANDDESFNAVRNDVQQVLEAAYNGAAVTLTRDSNSKTSLTIDVTVDGTISLADLAARLDVAVTA